MNDHDVDERKESNEEQRRIDAIVSKGPSGAFAVVGVATAIVIAAWFLFYLFAYLPRGVMQ